MRVVVFLLSFGLLCGAAHGQTGCASVAAYSPCELVFELNASEAQAHPKPYLDVDIQAEFQSPRHKTYLLPAYWDGGTRHVLRFTPTEAGEWMYRVSSNISRFHNKEGKLTAAASEANGFVIPANLHHWKYTEANRPHLWMGDTALQFGFMDEALFGQLLAKRSEQKFNHIRGLVLGAAEQLKIAFPKPDSPNLEHFRQLDRRILAMNQKGITADLILLPRASLQEFPTQELRSRLVRYLMAHFAPMNVTWQLALEFEGEQDGRALLQELGGLIKNADAYEHPRSSGARVTSSPLFADGWMNYVVEATGNAEATAVEHQLYPAPFVNVDFGWENSGAGGGADAVNAETFRHRLWNATMSGQYLTYANTGVGGRGIPASASYLDSPGAAEMKIWYELLADTRHWELEPYYDLDGARAVALEGVEYLVYLEKPMGPIEVNVEEHSYNVAWIDPATGERTPMKDIKGRKFTGEPPNTAHDWLLQISREGEKRSMLKSYRFDSRQPGLALQEAEQGLKQTPFEIGEPSAEVLKAGQKYSFKIKIKRATRGTRNMQYLWTGDVTADAQGFRILGTGDQGEFTIPPELLKSGEGVIDVRVSAVNSFGKLYQADKIYRVTK